MLCFSVESRDSLENVQEKWWDEIARHCEGPKTPAPLVHLKLLSCKKLLTFCGVGVKLALIALKCDLRDDEQTKQRLAKYGEKCVSYEEGLAMAKEIKAVRYLGTFPASN